jgi:hypothetical protein
MDLRDTMQTAVTEIKKQADALIVVKTRKVVFEDEVKEPEEDVLPLM